MLELLCLVRTDNQLHSNPCRQSFPWTWLESKEQWGLRDYYETLYVILASKCMVKFKLKK
ncbi:hypothetical protein ISN45_At05g014040 [Arabidopsis thaliana x Arabidopsis arenosa]|uniref:Uncharacterized protein n=1 Tax=Arabidopsis thaliana x Arabidopsis arenosa TaxID=1240361 RepID=A0A8T2CW41_9BRAS|nr:hypothetical protein ISN45_At05g014040 [Arabidopsis thaliana x Arabidopsis arenosa]